MLASLTREGQRVAGLIFQMETQSCCGFHLMETQKVAGSTEEEIQRVARLIETETQ